MRARAWLLITAGTTLTAAAVWVAVTGWIAFKADD